MALSLAIVLDLVSNILKIVGIQWNLVILQMLSHWIENSESYLLVFILLLIGHGWSIVFMNLEKKNDVFLPVLMAFSIVGVLI